MKHIQAPIITVILLFFSACSDHLAEGETQGFWQNTLAKNTAPNSEIMLRHMPEIDEQCKNSHEQQKEYLSSLSKNKYPNHTQTIYWAGVSYCAYKDKNFSKYRDYLGMMISSSLNTEKSNDVSEIVFSFIDNGKYRPYRICSLAAATKNLAVEDNSQIKPQKPFSRYGEAKTLNNFMCNTLDAEGIRRINK
jgi:hypothetical protein